LRTFAHDTKPVPGDSPQLRYVVAGPVVAVVTVLAALAATRAAALPLVDPHLVTGRRFVIAAGLVALLVALDILVRAARRSGSRRPSLAALASVRRERWTLRRGLAVGIALVSFHVTYLAYRNLKSVVPALRPGELFDRQLGELDRGLLAGSDPADVLHTVLGTGLAAPVLSAVYMLLFTFIPVTLALALVVHANVEAGLFYVTALALNWALGGLGYFLLPSLGPVYADPAAFAALPVTDVTHLQAALLDERLEFVRDPVAGTAQSIGAFPSLHVSIFFTAALATHLLGLARPLVVGAWILFAMTVAATIYFGWHYVLDDVAGLIIAVVALGLAHALTGFPLRAGQRSEAVPA
jgi:hypothetical protein